MIQDPSGWVPTTICTFQKYYLLIYVFIYLFCLFVCKLLLNCPLLFPLCVLGQAGLVLAWGGTKVVGGVGEGINVHSFRQHWLKSAKYSYVCLSRASRSIQTCLPEFANTDVSYICVVGSNVLCCILLCDIAVYYLISCYGM